MNQITVDTNAELEQLRKDFAEKVGLIKTDTEAELEEMSETAQAILTEAGWDETGKQIVTGITEGVTSEKSSFLDALTQMALEGVQAVKDTLEINSPSKVFRELGGYTGLGFVNGLSEYAGTSYKAGSAVGESAKEGLANALQAVVGAANGDMEFRPTICPVLDLSDVAKGSGDLDGYFYPRRTAVLAGEAVSSFEALGGRGDASASANNDDVVHAIQELRGDVSALSGTIRKIQVVLDTGALVGGLSEPMDSALGQRAVYRGRGI